MSPAYITVFADASYCPNSKVYGYCYWIKWGTPSKTVVQSGGGRHCKNAGEAEYLALSLAADYLLTNIPLEGIRVVLQSDCFSALNQITSKFGLFHEHKVAAVYTKHIKAHTGNRDPRSAVNRLCDLRAKREMRLRRPGYGAQGHPLSVDPNE